MSGPTIVITGTITGTLTELDCGERAIMASPEDYEVAYEVFKDTCERSIINLSVAHRKILDTAYELQHNLERVGLWDSYKGLSQRKITEKAGVSQSTVSENKTFLVTSAKLLRETADGGLALVDGAEPSWWETGDALVGFPRPQEVRAWWSGDTSTPDPNGNGSTGRDRSGYEGAVEDSTGQEHAEWIAKLVETIIAFDANDPKDIYWMYRAEDLLGAGAFDKLDRVPTEQEVEKALRVLDEGPSNRTHKGISTGS